MKLDRIEVEFAGPPSVITTIRSAKFAIQMVRSITVMAIIGARNGSVTLQNCCQPVAPSIAAASYKSFGIDCNAASKVMAKNGMPNQTFATTGPYSASCGSDRILYGSEMICRSASQ